MSLEEIWQEHKGFILSLAAGGLLFLVGWLLVTGSFEEDIRRNEAAARRAEAQERRLRLPSGAKREAEEALGALEDRLRRLERELAFDPDPGFTLAGIAKSPDIHFNETVESLVRDVVEPAAGLDIRIQPDLGIGEVTPRSDLEREWYLNGLDVVRRVCLAGIYSQVAAIEPIAIAAPPKRRRGTATSTPYLRELVVDFTAVGTPASVDGLLRGLMAPGRRLVVERAVITSLEGDRGVGLRFGGESVVRLEARVKALIVDPEGSPEVSGAERS